MDDDIRVIGSRKVEPAEAAQVDPARVAGATVPGPVAADVEAQWHLEHVTCAYCGGLNRLWVSDTSALFFYCVWCGRTLGAY